MTYLTIITTALVLTQIIRVIQNAIQLHKQTVMLKKQLSGFDEITQRDIDNQRKAYRLLIEFLEKKEATPHD